MGPTEQSQSRTSVLARVSHVFERFSIFTKLSAVREGSQVSSTCEQSVTAPLTAWCDDDPHLETVMKGKSKFTLIAETYALSLVGSVVLSTIGVFGAYITLPKVLVPMCKEFIANDYGSGTEMVTCILDQSNGLQAPWQNATTTLQLNADNYSYTVLYGISAYFFVSTYNFFLPIVTIYPIMIGLKHTFYDRVTGTLIWITIAVFIISGILMGLQSDLAKNAFPETQKSTRRIVMSMYPPWLFPNINLVLMVLTTVVMLARYRQEKSAFFAYSFVIIFKEIARLLSAGIILYTGIVTSRTKPVVLLLYRLLIFPVLWDVSAVITKGIQRQFGQVPLLSQVSELMPVVILRFFFERFLLTQLAGIGHVMVINLVFSFVGIVSSLTKRSYDEYFVKLKMRHTRAANAVMAAPTFNNVMLSMRFSELMSEHAAIWTTAALYQYLRINLGEPGTPPLMHNIYWSAFIQSAVAIVTDVVKLACETRFLAPFYLNVVDLRKLSWKVCVVVFFNACVVTWILCVHEFMAWATFVFCPREYSDVGLLWEMCSTEPLDFFGP